jgi:hypothetical protein
MRGLVLGAALAVLAAFGARAAELIDGVPMKPEKAISGKKPKRAGPVAKPPLAMSKVLLRFDFTLTEPVRRSDLMSLADDAPKARKDAFLKALLGYAAPAGSTELRAAGCCMRLRYAGCAYMCCGSRDSSCQDSCELLYCEAK